MRFVRPDITNTTDAIRIATPYIETVVNNGFGVRTGISGSGTMPKQASWSHWQMTQEALETTLSYIFDHLGHQCYMLCVGIEEKTGKKQMLLYKLVSRDLAPPVREKLEENIDNINANGVLTEAQKLKIKSIKNKPLRLLQCILKVQDSRAAEEPANYRPEHAVFMESLDLPYGVYILNLTDAVILKKDYTEALPIYAEGTLLPERYYEKPFLPIFSLSGQTGYADITMPNYDDIALATVTTATTATKWKKKTIPGAVFRGGPSGCGYTAETNQRIALAALSNRIDDATVLDAGIVSVTPTIDSKSMKFDPKHGLGMMNTGMAPVPRMTMSDQSKHKYIVHVDGNVNAYRLLTTMMTGSLILRVDSEYKSWADHFLKRNEHYILVRPDLSDLVEKIEWAKSHDSKAREIAEAGAALAARLTSREFMIPYIEDLFWTTTAVRLPAIGTRKNKNKNKKAKTEKKEKEKKKQTDIVSPSPPPTPTPSPPPTPTPSPPSPLVFKPSDEKKSKPKSDEDSELLAALKALHITTKPVTPTKPPPSTTRKQRPGRTIKEKKGGRQTKKNINKV